MLCIQRNSKNKSFSQNFDEKSMFFQTVISYGKNLQNHAKFTSIERKMFIECWNDKLIIINKKYGWNKDMSLPLSRPKFKIFEFWSGQRLGHQHNCPNRCPDQLCTPLSQPLSLPLPRPKTVHTLVPTTVPAPAPTAVPAPAPTNCARSFTESSAFINAG